MYIPEDLKYSKTHEWISVLSNSKARVGLTDFAQNSLGDIVFVNLPSIGDEAKAQQPIGEVESVKAVSDLCSPVDGKVCDINIELMDTPENLNKSPYQTWIFELEDFTALDNLLSPDEYKLFCEEEE